MLQLSIFWGRFQGGSTCRWPCFGPWVFPSFWATCCERCATEPQLKGWWMLLEGGWSPAGCYDFKCVCYGRMDDTDHFWKLILGCIRAWGPDGNSVVGCKIFVISVCGSPVASLYIMLEHVWTQQNAMGQSYCKFSPLGFRLQFCETWYVPDLLWKFGPRN